MRRNSKHQPPLALRMLIRGAALLVPRFSRAEWLEQRRVEIYSWWLLDQRGEFPTGRYAEVLRSCWAAYGQAFWMRFSRPGLLHFLSGPTFVPLACALVVTLTGLVSGGFPQLRGIGASLRSRLNGAEPVRYLSEDAVVVHSMLLVFAMLAGLVAGLYVWGAPRWHGWRYWGYFTLKTGALITATSAVWIESAAALRHIFRASEAAVVLSTVAATLAFVFVLGSAIAWSFADQRRRCPTCLHTMRMPVRLGSWSSVFEPARTELLCEYGHGRLVLPETPEGTPDDWLELDESWRDLFTPQPNA